MDPSLERARQKSLDRFLLWAQQIRLLYEGQVQREKELRNQLECSPSPRWWQFRAIGRVRSLGLEHAAATREVSYLLRRLNGLIEIIRAFRIGIYGPAIDYVNEIRGTQVSSVSPDGSFAYSLFADEDVEKLFTDLTELKRELVAQGR